MTNVTLNFEEAFASMPTGSTVADYMAAMRQYVVNLRGFEKQEDSFRNISVWKGRNRFSAAYVFSDELSNILTFDRKEGPVAMVVNERFDVHGSVGPDFHGYVTKFTTPAQRALYERVPVISVSKVPGFAIEYDEVTKGVVVMDVFVFQVPSSVLALCTDKNHRIMTAEQLASESVTSKLQLYLNSLK